MASLNDHNVREREQRLVYLITYSRADLDKIPTRETFSEVVEQAWMAVTGVKLKQWVVALEYHSDASSSEARNSSNFHMALKLEKRRWWMRSTQVSRRFVWQQSQFQFASQYVLLCIQIYYEG